MFMVYVKHFIDHMLCSFPLFLKDNIYMGGLFFGVFFFFKCIGVFFGVHMAGAHNTHCMCKCIAILFFKVLLDKNDSYINTQMLGKISVYVMCLSNISL